MGNDKKIQCHFISNTHWDREWRFSAQRTRYMLAYMMDMLFDILEKEPEFKHFHLDSQTMPIQDYLEVYPHKKDKIKKYVQEGKLAIGPWFNLPDEFSVGGESLVRNLLLGHKISEEFGGVSKTGYSPFGWGQISQLPQLYKGFGIDFTSFYRGLNEYVAPRSEFIWEGADGTQIHASRLGKRPRYNVWYILQRPVYFDQKNEDNRSMSWKDGHAPFRFIDSERCELDYQYAHPRYEYFRENVRERALQALEEQNNDWTTPHRFWSAGHDSSAPDAREVQMIADSNKELEGIADVFHSTVKNLEDSIRLSFSPDAPIIKGEMRHPYTKGSVSAVMGWIISARTYIKQDNFLTERDLTSYAEPFAVFASLMGAPYPKDFIDLAYNYLLQNHGHDTIGSCGRDIVYEDATYRFRQSKEVSSCVFERAMMDIAGDVNLSSLESSDMALVVTNPAPFKRGGVMDVEIEIPLEWQCGSFEIYGMDGNKIPVQITGKRENYQIAQNPNDVPNVFPSTRYSAKADFSEIPAMGYKTFVAKPRKSTRPLQPKTMLVAPNAMENEYILVTINSNGTFNVYDKATKVTYDNLGYFKDTGEIGDPWKHFTPEVNEIFTTLSENAKISCVLDGELEARFKVEINWALPEKRSEDEKTRSKHMVLYHIVNYVILRKGEKWVEIETNVDNTAEDHYLQVAFPTHIPAEYVHAQGQFDVVKRPIAKLDYSLYDEIPMTEQPMNSFVDLSDGKRGVALLNTGLKAYEAADDAQNTMYLSLLRCFPLRIYIMDGGTDYSQTDKGSQCLGKHSFRYAFMPHVGDWEDAKVWQASEKFNLKLSAVQIGPTNHGKAPLEKSFIEFKDYNLNISAVKKSEKGEGYIVRLFNPSSKKVKNSIRLNGGVMHLANQSPMERQKAEFELPNSAVPFTNARMLTLEELPVEDLSVSKDGWVDFEITPKKILTLEFRV